MKNGRIAIYLAPAPDTPLWRFGSRLIGYDAATSEDVPFPEDCPADPGTWSRWTEEPRLYGFHATLKAPFRLAEGARFDDAAQLARSLASRLAPFTVPRLAVRLIGSFAALVPEPPCPALDALAARCTEHFEPLRAKLTEAERQRRLRAPLSPRQVELLDRYGYPYVLDQFRFHMTLTGRLPPEEAERVQARLAALHGRLDLALAVDAICLFAQDAPGERFRIRERIALSGRG